MQEEAFASYAKTHSSTVGSPTHDHVAAQVLTPPHPISSQKNHRLVSAETPATVTGIVHTATDTHWIRKISSQGFVYYWNKKTQQTQWNHPFSGLVDPNVSRIRQVESGRGQPKKVHVKVKPAPNQTLAAEASATSERGDYDPYATCMHTAVEPNEVQIPLDPASHFYRTTASQPALPANVSSDPETGTSECCNDETASKPGKAVLTSQDTLSQAARSLERNLARAPNPEPLLVQMTVAQAWQHENDKQNRSQQAELAETILELQARHKAAADEWTSRFFQKQEELSMLQEKYMTEKMEMLHELSEVKQKAISDFFRGQQETSQKQAHGESAALQQLAQEHAETLKAQQEKHDLTVAALRHQKAVLEDKLREANEQLRGLTASTTGNSTVSALAASETAERLKRVQQKRLDELGTMHAAEMADMQQQLIAAKKQNERSVLEAVTAEERKWKEEVQQLRLSLASQVQEVRDMERAKAHAELAALTAERDAARAMYQRELRECRKLANEIIDLKGNIRVLARVRPIQSSEIGPGKEIQAVHVSSVELGVINVLDSKQRSHAFRFDAAFGPSSTQQEVFCAIQPLSDTVLDGYNVCIFAYGQTGSGKTYTMQGSSTNQGVTYRALGSLFAGLSERQEFGSLTEVSLQVSVLEVYNENIRDLLAAGPGAAQTKALELQRDRAGAMQVTGLSKTDVSTADEVLLIVDHALESRSTGSTDANAHSSRSHLVITLYCSCKHASGTRTMSKLHLIDLAGSERVGKTSSSGDRLKEAQHINKSLLALGDVIDALGSKRKSHVPYRNSKLTHLLSDSLSGGSKVLMVVNTSPALYNAPESICSMRFAERCRATELGRASKSTSG